MYRELTGTELNTFQLREKFPGIIMDKIVIGIAHCLEILKEFLTKFIVLRLKLSHQARYVHKKQMFASKFK